MRHFKTNISTTGIYALESSKHTLNFVRLSVGKVTDHYVGMVVVNDSM
jgi:hypothetical protein